ncbi:MAG: YkgJ family cysteine cluster protein [Labilithrix sp.]|nr:YkgJ family cysteine cluster protein [Labilithrix sp.]
MTERRVGLDHRDPMLRPFIEVEAKIIRDVVGDAKARGATAREVAGEVAELVHEDAEVAAETMSERLASGRRLPLACSAGCSYCCYSSTVHASAPEILRIASWLKENRSPEDLAALKERASAAAKDIAPLDLTGRARAKIPCPLLDVGTGRCTVYDVRPISCRAYHSGSVDACKKAHDDGEANPVLPIDPPRFQVAHAHAFGMMTALVGEGLDVGPYDLAAALPIALEHDLDERWLAGDKVLPHTRLSEEAAVGYDAVLAELVADLRGGRLDVAEGIARRLDPEARRKDRNRRKRDKRKR